eukprot:3327053-Prymnesium_polylepis.1
MLLRALPPAGCACCCALGPSAACLQRVARSLRALLAASLPSAAPRGHRFFVLYFSAARLEPGFFPQPRQSEVNDHFARGEPPCLDPRTRGRNASPPVSFVVSSGRAVRCGRTRRRPQHAMRCAVRSGAPAAAPALLSRKAP